MILCLMACGNVLLPCFLLTHRGVGGTRAGPADDRAALREIIYVLRKGVTWADVPAEKIGCSGVACRRRLRDWTEACVWPPPARDPLGVTSQGRAAGHGRCRGRRLSRAGLEGGLTPDLCRSTAAAPAASTT